MEEGTQTLTTLQQRFFVVETAFFQGTLKKLVQTTLRFNFAYEEVLIAHLARDYFRYLAKNNFFSACINHDVGSEVYCLAWLLEKKTRWLVNNYLVGNLQEEDEDLLTTPEEQHMYLKKMYMLQQATATLKHLYNNAKQTVIPTGYHSLAASPESAVPTDQNHYELASFVKVIETFLQKLKYMSLRDCFQIERKAFSVAEITDKILLFLQQHAHHHQQWELLNFISFFSSVFQEAIATLMAIFNLINNHKIKIRDHKNCYFVINCG